MIAWLILFIFLLAYAAFSGAILWHLHIYSFSRSANAVIFSYIAISVALAIISIFLFAGIDWGSFIKIVGTNTTKVI